MDYVEQEVFLDLIFFAPSKFTDLENLHKKSIVSSTKRWNKKNKDFAGLYKQQFMLDFIPTFSMTHAFEYFVYFQFDQTAIFDVSISKTHRANDANTIGFGYVYFKFEQINSFGIPGILNLNNFLKQNSNWNLAASIWNIFDIDFYHFIWNVPSVASILRANTYLAFCLGRSGINCSTIFTLEVCNIYFCHFYVWLSPNEFPLPPLIFCSCKITQLLNLSFSKLSINCWLKFYWSSFFVRTIFRMFDSNW